MDGLHIFQFCNMVQTTKDLVGQERSKRRRQLADNNQAFVQGLVSGSLVLPHLALPEPASVPSNVPVRKLIHRELAHSPGSPGDVICVHRLLIPAHQGIHLREYPPVDFRALFDVNDGLLEFELVDVCIERKERVRVDQRTEESALNIRHTFFIEEGRTPNRAVRNEIPPGRIRSVFADERERIDRVLLGLGHLLSLLVQDMLIDQHILVCRLVKEDRPDGMESVEPPSCLVYSLRDVIGGIGPFEDLLVFERIVPLGEGHGPGIKPYVNKLRCPFHAPFARVTNERYIVDKWFVEIERIRNILSPFQLLDASDTALVPAFFANPDWKRRSPESVPRERPVLVLLKPVAETPLTHLPGNPVDGLVQLYHSLGVVGGLDIPGLPGIIK